MPGLLLAAVCGLALLFPYRSYRPHQAGDGVAAKNVPEVFSVLGSLGPAISACVGVVVLHQILGPAELAGVACVVGASVGATLAARR